MPLTRKVKLRQPMTDAQIRAVLDRISAIQTNRTTDDDIKTQLIAVSMTLHMVRGEKNYIDEWLRRAELQVIEHHKMIRPGGCECGVCRKPQKGPK